jgi:tetratricopeptide (TPR) repeat protein
LAYDYLINLLGRQNRHIEAYQIYGQAANLLPHNTEKYYILKGYALHSTGEFSKASLAYKKAIRKNPKNAITYLSLGELLQYKLNRPDEAEKCYRRTIELDPQNANGYFQLGLLLFTKFHRYEEAEMYFLKAQELDPQDAPGIYNIACVKAILGDYDTSFRYLKEAIQKGFEKSWAQTDPDLENLRKDPRFDKIVGERKK